jgi:uncharacterized membrane protein
MFVGLPVGFLLCFALPLRPKLSLVILTVLPMGIDGGLQAITSYESFNLLRFATGALGGLAVAFFLVMIAGEMYKDSKKPDI